MSSHVETPSISKTVLPQSAEMKIPVRRRHGIANHPWTRSLFATGFRAVQHFGLNLTPKHFYWPIPDLQQLETHHWQALSEMIGIGIDFDRQLDLLNRLLTRYREEMHFPEGPSENPREFCLNNGFFETVDAEMCYSLVRDLHPQRMIEVGGGNTTRLSAGAMLRNAQEGNPGELFTVEPFPDPVLRAGIPGMTQLIPHPVQHVPIEFFESLKEGDILFLDSSHVVAVGSDVRYEYLEILPRLKPGVIVHVHDIFLPADYPRQFVMKNLCFWSEQYILHAFLAFNPCFEVLWAGSAMHIARRRELQRAIPHWRDSHLRMPKRLRNFTPTYDGYNVWPCSFWMRRTSVCPRVRS